MKIFDEAWEPSIKSRTLFLEDNANKTILELKEKHGFIPIHTMDELSIHAPMNEYGEHEFVAHYPQAVGDFVYKNLLVYLSDDDTLLGLNWKWESSETEPYRHPGHPLMLMVRSARKLCVRVVFVAVPEMRENHPLLMESDFYNWAPVVS